jgi:twitching motility protein PilT
MSALDSLIGLLELRKADSLVLVAGEPPTLLGGRDTSLTMPPLDAATMTGFLEELLSAEQREVVSSGQSLEVERASTRSGPIVVRARNEGGKVKLVLRRGKLRVPARPAAPASAPPALAPSPEPVPRPARPTPPVPLQPDRLDASSPLAPLLAQALVRGVSDVILSSGRPPVLRIRGEVLEGEGPVFDPEELLAAFELVLGDERRRRLAETGSADFGLELATGAERPLRFRGNLFRRYGGLTAVLRPIWEAIPSLEELGLPRGLRRVIESPNGLVLFAGPTGSGKSTTLAALVELINQTRASHVLTLEDPIEYVFPPGRSVIHQREVGAHVSSFADGLRAALRESPDVILLGEMRDPDTSALALAAAETGHLVLSTIHAASAAGAIERVVSALPEVERAALRIQLASVLRHIVVQQLLPALGSGRVPAIGMLAVNHAVASLIREGRTQLLATQMEIGAEEGMVTMEAALAELVRSGRISRETALGATTQRDALEALLADRSRPLPKR